MSWRSARIRARAPRFDERARVGVLRGRAIGALRHDLGVDDATRALLGLPDAAGLAAATAALFA